MNVELPDCMSCGLCCRQPVGPPAPYPEDIERWAAERTPEIGHRFGGCREAACPFLVVGPGFRCAIYPTRPAARPASSSDSKVPGTFDNLALPGTRRPDPDALLALF